MLQGSARCDRRAAADARTLSSNRKLPRIERSASRDALVRLLTDIASCSDASLVRINDNPPLPSGPLRVVKTSKEVILVVCRGLDFWNMFLFYFLFFI